MPELAEVEYIAAYDVIQVHQVGIGIGAYLDGPALDTTTEALDGEGVHGAIPPGAKGGSPIL